MFSHRLDHNHELKLLEAHHADALFALAESNRDFLRRWLPWLCATHQAANTLDFIKASLRQFADGEGFVGGVWFNGNLVGVIGHHGIDWASRTSTLGYWLTENHQGRGVMTRACEAVIDHAFTTLKLNKVVIRCASDNVRSQAIPKRLGFVHEGTLPNAERLHDRTVDIEIYGCLEWDWEKRKSELEALESKYMTAS